MVEELLNKYGLVGLAIGALAWFALYMLKEKKKQDEKHANEQRLAREEYLKEQRISSEEHKEEREEWRETIEGQFKEHNHVMRETASILSGLKTYLETRK